MPRPKVHPDLPPVRGATAADTAPPLAIGSADSSSTQGDPVDHSNPNGSAKFPMRNIRVSVTLADESSTDKATPSIVPRSTTWSSRSRRNTDPGPVGADDARERSSILMPPQHDPLDFSDLSDADGVDTDGAPAEAGPAEAGLADTTAHSAFAPRDIPSRDIPSTSRRSSAPPAQSDSTPQGRKRSSVMSFLFRSLSSDHVAAAAVQTSSKWHAAKHAIVAFSERRLPDQESSRKKLGAMLAPGALGTLTFSNYNTAMYARVGSTSRQVRSALIRHLAAQYGYPRLLLSVAGGAQDFQLSSDLLHVLTRGLTAVADATPVWLTTPGTNSGVTTYAGRVVKNANASVAGIDAKRARIPAIGMVTAGVQRGREQLRDPDTTRIFDYNSLSPAKSGPKSPNVGLDENHHVFLCYDDLVDDKFGREVSFRTRFEEDMRYLKLNSSATLSSQQPFLIKDECAVAVQLIVEGGPITLKIVEDSIKSGMPVVVLEGSGRCADVISYAWRFLHDTSISARTKYTEGGLRGEIRKLGKKTLAAILATEKRVLSLVAVKSWVTVCTTSEKASRHSDDAVNLDGAILQAVVQSLTFKPKHDYSVKQIVSGTMTHCGFYYGMDPYEAGLYVMHRTQLSWALTFNNVVSAKFHLSALQNLVTDCRATLVSLGDSTYQRARHVLKEHTSDIKDVLVWALCHANVRNDFVIMFCGPLSNSDALYELLMSDAGDLSSPSETFDTTRRKSKRTRPDGSSGSESVALMKCGRSVRDTLFAPSTNRLSEKRMEALYRWAGTKTSESWETDGTHCMNAVVARLLRLDKRRLCVVGHRGADPSMQTVVEKKNSAYRDLLIWATISSQSQLADFFWQEGGHSISSALFTALLLKRMRAAAPMQRGEFHNSRVLMLEMANHFEDRAVGVLEECQRENAKFTEYILWRNLANLGLTKSECQIRDALSLAAHGGCMKFISHSACLAAVSVAWHGAIVPETSILVILANALCPIFLILNCFRCNFRSFDAVQNIRSLRGNAKEGASSMGHKLPSRGRESQSRESLASSDEKTQEKSQEWTSVEKIVGLYTAPVTKYLLHFLEHVSLLLLITTEVLSDYASDDPLKWYTIATLLIVVNHVLHQIALMCEKGRLDWYTNAWNRYDMLTYTFFGLGLGLRIYSGGDRGNIAVWAKFVMVVVTLMLFLRFFRFYYLQPQLGPKLIMLQKMTRDVLTFLALLVVILVAYAIAFEAMRRPFTEHDWGHAQDGLRILLLPSFQMFGEIFLEDMEQETGCAGPQLFQSCQNQLQGFVLPVLIFIYCLLSNVVLVNLLIAMMGRTYEEVQVSAFEQWHLQLYFLLKDYEDWTVLPAPLSVFESLYRIGNAVFVRLCKDRPVDHVLSPIAESEAHFGASPKGPQLAMLESFQEKCTQRYFDEANKITVSPAEEKQTSKLDRIDAQIEHMHARLEDILMDTEILKQAFNSECQRQTFGRTMQNCDPGGLSARQRVSSGQWSPATRISRANSIDDSSTNGAGSLDELIRIYRQDRCAPSVFRSYPFGVPLTAMPISGTKILFDLFVAVTCTRGLLIDTPREGSSRKYL